MTEFSHVTVPPLVTLTEAKIALRLTGTTYDADVQQKIDAAQDDIIRYLNLAADASWTPATVPPGIKNCILRLAAFYYRDRGDGTIPSPWPTIYDILGPSRDPTVAC